MPVSGQTDTVQGHNQNNKTVPKKKKTTASKQKEGGKKGKSAFPVIVFCSNEKIVKLLNCYGVNSLCQSIFHRSQSIRFTVCMLLTNNRYKV